MSFSKPSKMVNGRLIQILLSGFIAPPLTPSRRFLSVLILSTPLSLCFSIYSFDLSSQPALVLTSHSSSWEEPGAAGPLLRLLHL